ncbi:hypothetical protein Dsin_030961 [Dipteronia sinensis]|uniref:At1g61320/AtMIF1 LRR domain-containing protein n=1 Tax=Dipteronia sinensis TaxID=43782 RepID=A0AAD9ZLL2_9ROSI|nr:hypothetical protein Dsin_030961 [Dipteronia sinensis]
MRNRHCRDMICLKKFKLELIISNDREFVSFVYQCICHAIGCNVKELKLIFTTVLDGWYNLPQILLCANSVEDLKLKMCKLKLPRNYVKLSSLRKLFLTEVYMDDHMIKNLVGGCPLIEDLHFVSCEGFKGLELFGLTRLNEIKLIRNGKVERVDINALNVRLLEIFGPAASCKINLAFCKNLTSLTLYGASIRDQWFYNQISKLSP